MINSVYVDNRVTSNEVDIATVKHNKSYTTTTVKHIVYTTVI